ncbi:transmembrane 9 superfamily member 4-like [Cornus florida]|uniref:transmembrane 9 superfamily member 4-like n=1 Tax=Cornus florida TaxID=4283 RepID=UPI00289A90D7|nr:transmembrane 9 superfamily member 4-like [Cornus florida]
MDRISGVSFFVMFFTALLISVRSIRHLPDKNQYEVTEVVVTDDYVPVFANKAYSDDDPCVAIPYFQLPFCPPGNPVKNRKKSLQEIMEGDCFTNTQYELNFKVDKNEETLCEKNLTRDEVAKFRYAIKNEFGYQMYYNGIKLYGRVGHIVEGTRTFDPKYWYFLFLHITFDVYYVGNKVQKIHIVSDSHSSTGLPGDIDGKNVKFTYSVFWKNQGVDSMDKREHDPNLLEEQQEKLDFIYSVLYFCSIIAFWIGLLLSVIVLYLRNYFSRYFNRDVREARRQIHMRQIHGEACRCPPYPSLLGAILGIGTQQFILCCTLFVLVYKGDLFPCNQNALLAYLLVIYWFTSAVSGYIATSFHSQYTEDGWQECVFQTGTLYLVPAIVTFLIVNILEQVNEGISDLPRSYTTLWMLFSWGLGTFAFLSVGGMIGHVVRAKAQPPCATSRIPRAVNPQLSWYTKTPAQVFLGGLLPFITVFWDMDYIYASLWNQKVCGAFSTLLTNFIVVSIATIIVAMSLTYIQLCQQDQQWAWRSVLRGGSAAIFMFAYGVYFHVRADRFRPMKLLYFMGYNACIFYAFFLVLGAISFHASQSVFRFMYHGALKDE